MSTSISEKLVLIRKSEYMTRKQFSEATGVPVGTLNYYETGRSTPPTDVSMRILNIPQFTKYTLWFMTDKVAPEAGQIAPVLAHFGQEEGDSSLSDQKIG
ncbi:MULTISPECIES: helix-turn-helix domain-containing protein [Aeromonas]|uniref:helix-turn-helix domain-containing protein n=1 Tax=Aeromonas TaxID=642 RepID=UPI0004932EAF|nr:MULTISPECIES: helix-turn-helix transcriptional regulator [Aeromonas]HAT1544265.1 helix-turn-helix transcriptional regulator [Aeromonas hydrophila]HAT1557236.1 helix-turn-helix transcriptional regulator [Aeromonas hydrophila]HDU8492499.1 helix-turn-helix transcriptional regulator [Aeromonas hydrophila]